MEKNELSVKVDKDLNTELELEHKFTDKQEIEFHISKDKVYAEYRIKF